MEPQSVKGLLARSWQCCLHDESHLNCSGIKHWLETVSSNHLCICMSPPVTQAVGRAEWRKTTSFVSLSLLNPKWSLLCLGARYQREMQFVFSRAAFTWRAGAELLLAVLYKDSCPSPALSFSTMCSTQDGYKTSLKYWTVSPFTLVYGKEETNQGPPSWLVLTWRLCRVQRQLRLSQVTCVNFQAWPIFRWKVGGLHGWYILHLCTVQVFCSV